ncbi:hypothetical protein [Streptomyces griseiscabiei]|uniref:Secreted protein n=1 Tax=Streptomyces griseiscabiei TaxID=2993540 RepID=A0ABU4LJJ2_9ACTN|nr:hypothetical protein [Streptomyces griseiscabiei]MBZ3900569.1 hypothetical protein [Streptomyces griseiscabiei]MDX2915904.1 hypothetical protein [Streptomyces griseiscabiei]
MRIRHTATAVTAAVLLALTACSSADTKDSSSGNPSAPATRKLDTAPNIAAALNDAGFNASTPQEKTDASYITKVGGTSYSLTITDKAGQTAPGESGINMFPNAEALKAWIPLSKSFGGVAVTGDTWAVSLPTKSKEARADSLGLAPKVAEALDGTVQR